MSGDSRTITPWSARDLIAGGVFLGLASGLTEGAGHVAIQRLGVLEHSWYPIIWIAAAVNAVLLAGVGLLMYRGQRRLPDRLAQGLPVFALSLAAIVPVVALVLKEWVRPYGQLALTIGLAAFSTRWVLAHRTLCLRHLKRALRMTGTVAVLVFIVIQGGSWLRERIGTALLPAARPGAPDVLVVIIDALRADHLSAYGYPRSTSPTIDELAANGVLFEQAYASSSYTLPSHASLLTGLYPSQHGVEWRTSQRLANATYPTLPELAQALGYRTGAFSGNTFWFTRAQGFGRGFHRFDDFFHSGADMALRTAYGRIFTRSVQRLGWGFRDIPARKRADETNAHLLRWIARDPIRPFLAVVNYMDVHDPYLPPEPYRSRFSPTPGPGGIINWEFHVPDRLSPGELQSEVDAYDGAIAYADHQLGRLLAGLAARRPGRDLLVFLTSDHGEEFGEHGGFLHGAHLYRETIQVPLVLWQPGRVPAGRRVAQPVSNASIPATVLDLVNGNPERFPVPSLTALWRESPPAAWPMPVAELSQRTWAPARHPVHHGSLRSAVDQEWHYIESSAGSPELFHLLTDPKELNNRAAEDALTPVIARFRRGLPAWRHGAAFERLPPVLADLSPVAPAKAQSAQTPNGLQ